MRKRLTDLSPYERLGNAVELGPIFVKFGQILSTRPDRLPEPLVMEKAAQPGGTQRFEAREPVLLKDLGGSIEDVFDQFDKEPFAAGSLGQVYRASLRASGDVVAVKVQRADIHKTVSADLEIIAWFARQLHTRVDELRPYNLPALVSEAEKRLQDELDFRNEADNAGYSEH